MRRIVLSAALACLSVTAFAHHRDFAFMRDWLLPYKGEKEIESRTTYIPRLSEFGQEFEFEYGITDHFAIEPGIEFHRDRGDEWHIDGYDVELRFNFGEFTYNRPLLALNVEYEHPTEEDEPDAIELKGIVSVYTEDGGDFSFNLNWGKEIEGPKEDESEFLLGYVHQLSRKAENGPENYNLGIRGGFEYMHGLKEGHDAIGPTLVIRQNRHFNLVGTFLFGLNHGDENPNQFRLIGEYEF